MTQILLRLSLVNFLALAATFTVGLLSVLYNGLLNPESPLFPLHLYLGLFSVSATLGLHCLVFIYFLGTGRWVKEVALAYQMPDVPLPRQTRELKRQAFPWALFAMLVTIATAAAGAGQHHGWHWSIHLSLASLTLLVNLQAFFVESRCVRQNTQIIHEVMQEVDRIRSERGLVSNEEALRQQQESTRTSGT
jgi:hypothetical protein